MPRRSKAEVQARILRIVAIADAGRPTNPAFHDRYDAAARIAAKYRKANAASCFTKPFRVAALFAPTESFYEIFPSEDPANDK
jgi:hypothetical protein